VRESATGGKSQQRERKREKQEKESSNISVRQRDEESPTEMAYFITSQQNCLQRWYISNQNCKIRNEY